MNKKISFLILAALLTLSGCRLPTETIREAEKEIDGANAPKRLTVLLTGIPANVNLLGTLSESGATIADALFDGPFDEINGEEFPVIFSSVSVETEAVEVVPGETIYSAAERAEPLTLDTRVIPADSEAVCGYSNCGVTLATLPPGAPLRLTRATVTFILRDELRWSDGEPVTAEDAALSYELFGAGSGASERTGTYEIVGDRSLRWVGIPGYVPARLANVFLAPIPSHSFHGKSLEEILSDPTFTERPSGWGAYRFADSKREDGSLFLERNPYYFGGPAPYDEIVFAARGRGEDSFAYALTHGSGTITQAGIDFSDRIEPLLEDIRDRKLSASIYPTLDVREIIFNFESANLPFRELIADSAARSALTQCVDRARLIREIVYGQSEIPVAAYPSFHALSGGVEGYIGYDPANGRETVAALGGEGLPLKLTYIAGETNRRTAAFVRDGWRDCGLAVEIEEIPLQAFGQLQRGEFDAALTLRPGGALLPCRAWLSTERPDDAADGSGINLSRFGSKDVDALCAAARFSPPIGGGDSMIRTAQSIFNTMAITIPLYFEPRFALTTADVCGVASVIGMRSILWNVERLRPAGIGEDCYAPQWNDIYQQLFIN